MMHSVEAKGAHRDYKLIHYMRHGEAAVGEDVYKHVGRDRMLNEELIVCFELCMAGQAAALQQGHGLIVYDLDHLHTAHNVSP